MGSIIKTTRKITRARISVQLAVLAILNVPLLRLHSICAPVLYCHSCPLSAMACPVGVLVNFSTFRVVPFITIGILGLTATVGGRLVCGWVCPFGLLQDILYKIRSRKIALPPALGYLRYVVLIGLVFAVPFFLPGKPYTFCNFCPAGTLESTIPWAFMGVSSGYGFSFFLRIGILLGVILFAVTASRGFCRTLCPLGAIFSLFNRFSLFKLSLTKGDCNGCGACGKMCPVDIDPVKQMNAAQCTRCLDCTSTGHIKLGTG